ncbi:homoserine O-acetyltransferase MetX [Facilibium subflavum]|uniref:homoserine O-acetyltransferase MetX n=1 Tax=Facilibium subflavum TaxID=2219058 RepID=UPI000E65DD70|nr:homoserine O-acetyltransferase [Facilibium subflavum]
MIIVKKNFAHLGKFTLASGEHIDDLVLAYEVYGQLNTDKSNAILLAHTLTGNQHAAGVYQQSDQKPGWWNDAIGAGKDINTDQYCVICINNLGGCHGSLSPMSINPKTNKPYALDFPVIHILDMVHAEKKLMDYLKIPQWHCLIGGCMGGFKILQWLTHYPKLCQHAILMATSYKVSAHTIASWYIMKQCIISDPNWNHGNYYHMRDTNKGLNFANMVGSMIWLSRDYFESHFANKRRCISNNLIEPEYEIEYFLDSIQHKPATSIDPNSLLYMMKAMSSFDLTDDELWPANLQNITGNVLLISYQNDWRYPANETEKLAEHLRLHSVTATHKVINSDFGHGAFIYDYKSLSPHIKNFLTCI